MLNALFSLVGFVRLILLRRRLCPSDPSGGDTSLGVGGAGLDVLGDDVDTLHDHAVLLAVDRQHCAFLAAVAAGKHFDCVALFDFESLEHGSWITTPQVRVKQSA